MVLCVAGPMAAGKNQASAILEEKGFAAIDADLVGHEAVDLETEKIVSTFSALAAERNIALTDESGKIIRRNLGALIFGDNALLKAHEDIVYPRINAILAEFIERNKDKNVVINATVLYKIPIMSKVNSVLYIDAPAIMRFMRARKRDGMPARLILKRFKSQRNLFAKYKNACADTRRVWNIGTRTCLKDKIDQFLTLCR